ncbi:MAG: Trk system potassium transporter TrkA [Ruminococcaceae bacterium]|nr:Trk system potassium transporter TrkA [Oscillospiraceae bacterium]
MKIIIAGLGKIGTTILASLVAEGHDVVAIDSNPDIIDEITNIYDVIGVCGNGADTDALSDAGVDKAELFVAVTGSDEFNMLSCFIARKMGAAHTIARIRSPEYNDNSLVFMKQHLGLSMAINPELLAAHELYNILKFPSAVKIETFSHRNFEMIEIKLKPDSILDGLSLMQLRHKYKSKILICTVQRDDKVYIPDGNFVLKSGDKIGITAELTEFQKFFKELGIFQKQAKNVMILGGSRTAFYLARRLINGGSSVKIIEQRRERCDALSEAIPKAVIIHGDGAQQELLMEEGLDSLDAFVALTGMDEENILISIFAASHSVPTVISKVNRNELSSMAEKLGLDCIVSPKKIISDILVRYARALENSMDSKVETLYKLMDGKAEALEFKVGPDFKYTNIPIKDLRIQENILLGGIIRNKPVIPSGNDVILPNDRVIVVATDKKIRELSDIFES